MINSANSILIVEDDANDILLLRRAFSKAGLVNPVHVASDGDMAVDYLQGNGVYRDRAKHPLPVLILLDLKLPRRSGHEVLNWLRAQSGLRRIPVVILTSSKESKDLDRAYDEGANSYLIKPADPADLLEMVKQLNLYWMVFNEKPDIKI